MKDVELDKIDHSARHFKEQDEHCEGENDCFSCPIPVIHSLYQKGKTDDKSDANYKRGDM